MFMTQVGSGATPVIDWLRLIQAEYLEVPGLHLTRGEVERFWGLSALKCDELLGTLVATGFLRKTPAGRYVRASV